MRRQDKYLNIQKANLLAEERYLKSKGLIKETHPDTRETSFGHDMLAAQNAYFTASDQADKSGEPFDPIDTAKKIGDENRARYSNYMGEDESKPKMIEIKFLPGWEKRLSDMKIDNLEGHTPLGSTVQLSANNYGVKIGSGPYEMRENKRTFYYATYRPEFDEITVTSVNCFGHDAIESKEKYNYLNNSYMSDSYQPKDFENRDKWKDNFCVSAGGFYSKFENGFEVGERDHREYFEIVNVE